MPHKNAFEPKDARIMSYYEDDELNDELTELNAKPRRKKTTGTQALAEFLSTTSPEEFQRNNNNGNNGHGGHAGHSEPSSTNFFKLRKGKRGFSSNNNNTTSTSTSNAAWTRSKNAQNGPNQRLPPPGNNNNNNASAHSSMASYTTLQNSTVSGSSATSTAYTVHRKNYIEIIPKMPPPPPASSSAASNTGASDGQSLHSLLPTSPMLPGHKRRESSLYSGSLRHSASIKSQLSGRHRPMMRPDTFYQPPPPPPSTHPASVNPQESALQQQALLAKLDNMDVIEAALTQRLERCRLADQAIPSDVVAKVLGNEHIRALTISFQQEETLQMVENEKTPPLGKARHVQVQTMPIPLVDPPKQHTSNQPENEENDKNDKIDNIDDDDDDDDDPLAQLPELPATPASTDLEKTLMPPPPFVPGNDAAAMQLTLESLERQLAEERKQRMRLQTTLDNTRDHFEVLSGLAYKKLRELWEEKSRWESACMDLSQQVLALQQKDETQDTHHTSPTILSQEAPMDAVSMMS
ncbi:hypothetical protein BC940DRAFT_308134 [Gongronella butleri]|nr:hypothetical protein BC940DRAFT_308134 [Gongronella butleri]